MRPTRVILLVILAVAAATYCRPRTEESPRQGALFPSTGPVLGGVLRIGIRSEPLTWNGLLVTDEVSYQVAEQIHSALVRVNRVTQEVEPELAESWSFSGRELIFRLRRDVVFSDGVPFTAADVAFTFRALHDPDAASPLVETALVDGEPLVPEVVDSHTVRFHLPRRTAVVERIFDGIPMLPRHRLERSLAEGDFSSEYGVGASADGIVGLGPFVLERYVPGQRVMLRRNPRYWKVAEDGDPLPYLDGITYEIVPDASALMLRFRGGELDILSPVSPEDYLGLKESAPPELRLLDLGPGTATERIWFNLNPKGPVSAEKRAWFSERRFRRAVSLAMDRPAIAQAVYLGLASPAAGPVSPANPWWNDDLETTIPDADGARKLLSDAGFSWGDAGGLLGPGGNPVRFTLVTNADNPYRVKTAAIIQEDLARIGMEMNLVPLDFTSLLGRVTRSFDYEACLFSIKFTDPDPSAELPLWLSRSPFHVWHPAQAEPATPWEARIDHLMEEQMLAVEAVHRKELFDEVQSIVVTELPVIDLVVPHALLGVTRRVGNLRPTPFWNPAWNGEELYLRPEIAASE